MTKLSYLVGIVLILGLSACPGSEQGSSQASASSPDIASAASSSVAPGSAGNSELTLPAGFQVSLFAEGVGPARHMVARANGDVYLRLDGPQQGHGLVALRDQDQNGQAEEIRYFGPADGGTGLALDADYLYYANATEVWRQALRPELVPTARPERLVSNLGQPSAHNARSLALDGQGNLYVNVGAPSNACQVRDRQDHSPGQNPCPLLNEFGGIWRFKTHLLDQDKVKNGLRYATGIRNAVALDWNTQTQQLYVVPHGRDQLHELYPSLYSEQQGSELPAEELAAVSQGSNLGWPYCYYDQLQQKKVLAPEYGGDGQQLGQCGQYLAPLVGFPGHYAPNDLLFYTGSQFPPEYKNGAFVAFHGSWNRSGQQAGYQVAFVPLNQNKAGAWKTFADGFAGSQNLRGSGDARYRPVGLAQLPDGALLIADSKQGRIWKVSYSRAK